MIKITIDPISKDIIKYEPAENNIIYADFDINDTVVRCKSKGIFCKIQDSFQGKRRAKNLKARKKLNEFEKQELNFLSQKIPGNIQENTNDSVNKRPKRIKKVI